MPRHAALRLSRRPATRQALALLVAAGYLAALVGTTASRLGWQSLAHLALAPPSFASPAIYGESLAVRLDDMSTLRQDAQSSSGHAPRALAPASGQAGSRAPAAGPHEAEWHAHEPAPPDPAVGPVVSLDTHHLPSAPGLGPPLPPHAADYGAIRGTMNSADLSVETPPPLARG